VPLPGLAPVATATVATATVARASAAAAPGSTVLQRRGLPRAAGGEPWPAARPIPLTTASVAAPTSPQAAAADTSVVPSASRRSYRDLPREPKRTHRRYRGRTAAQWVRLVTLGGGGLLVAAVIAVLFVRWLLGTPPLQDFLSDYPGEYHLPEWAPVGFPSWLNWAHFFNVFLMVLIIRSGWQIRTDPRPGAFWSPKWNPQRKISLTVWFHQALDLLWILNGVIFVVLLFVTGQWVRIVPTSWEVLPNAVSAGLQYVSLDWPTENGWVNYNSLQQLAYFATVFLAAPLAAATGVRMSGLWPKNNRKLSKAYPIEVARAIHFPVMLYFVVFIIFHVALVFATGALRNLNHMYAGQDVINWTGFWILLASLAVIVGGVIAARPLFIAPIASLLGRVGR
jgi:thiosulfate reductase cytochrome b subunit